MADTSGAASIYVVTNTINGKQYVGQTWLAVALRWRAHCNAARTSAKYCKMPIVNAIRKYGEQAFNVATVNTLKPGSGDVPRAVEIRRRRSTSGRWRVVGDSTAVGGGTVRDFFMAAPFLGGFRLGLVTTRVPRAVRSRRFNFQQLSGHPPGSTQADLDAAEEAAISRLNTLVPGGYNLRLGGARGRHHAETRAVISKKLRALGRHHSEEHKARLSAMMMGRPVTWGNKISASLSGRAYGAAIKGRPKSDEHRQKLSESHKGRIVSLETRAKLSIALTGRRLSPERRSNIARGLRESGLLKGRIFTPEWRLRLSESRRQRHAEGRDPQRGENGQWIHR